MDMTTQQKIAIRRPCFDAEETSHPAFGWRPLDRWISLRLTVNIGME